MKSGNYRVVLAGFALWAWLLPATTVLAALGKSADSIADDRRVLSAEHRRTDEKQGYTVREMQSASVTVREYVSPSNVVFGVGWNGINPPDLDQLLGPYGPEYRQSLRNAEKKPGHRSSRVKADRVVVETWGHMRNLQGRAYVPALVPEGVDIDEIK